MFGFLRPCRHLLGPELHALWTAHLCGLCLGLRDRHGQLARATTHTDALVVSVLADAQGVGGTRRAGPCALRGLRPATVVTGPGAALAGTTSLLLAAGRVADHVDDGDLPAPAGRLARTWGAAGRRGAAAVALDPTALLAVPARQREVEARPGADLDAVTAPTAAAVGAALAHTAVLAGRPANAAPLDEAGRLLGTLAHLLDALDDRAADRRRGRWNPLDATGTSDSAAIARARDAVRGIGAALRRVATDPARPDAARLAHRLLVHGAAAAVDRRTPAGERDPAGGGPIPPWDPARAPGSPGGPGPGAPDPGGPGPDGPGPEGPGPDGEPGPDEAPDGRPVRPHGPSRGVLGGAVAALGLCCTGQLCCAEEFTGPWSGRPRDNWLACCGDGCSCGCDGCDCCSSCGDGCCDCGCGCD